MIQRRNVGHRHKRRNIRRRRSGRRKATPPAVSDVMQKVCMTSEREAAKPRALQSTDTALLLHKKTDFFKDHLQFS